MKFPISDILEVLFLKNCKYSGVSTINLSWMNFGQNMFLLNCQERICMRRKCFISHKRSLVMAHLLTKIIISFQRENNLSCWTHINPFLTILSLAASLSGPEPVWPPTSLTPTPTYGWPSAPSCLVQLLPAGSACLLVNSNNVKDRGPKLLCNENKLMKVVF